MKRILAIFVAASLITGPSFGSCNFANDITKNADGTYTYSKECHVEVGVKLQENRLREQQVEKLNKAIEMKDLVIEKAETRVEKWQTTTGKLEDRVNTIERMNDTNKVLYFGLGIALTALAVWGAGRLH